MPSKASKGVFRGLPKPFQNNTGRRALSGLSQSHQLGILDDFQYGILDDFQYSQGAL
jgi:hypothetical protein